MDISFVLSNKLRTRLARHVLFWIVMLTYQAVIDYIVPTLFEDAQHEALRDSIYLILIYLPGQLVLTYGLIYIVIPYFFFNFRFITGLAVVACLLLLAGLANELSYQTLAGSLLKLSSGVGKHSLGMHRMMGVAGFASCIKFVKYWYEQNVEKNILEKEKLKAELQSLKAQIHPHFLFNTLNNIYSITQDTSKEASEMLLRLSSLLRYILYECNKPEITLEQEFKIINDYVALETIRYGKKIDIHLDLAKSSDNYMIAPLLLLPLVENCFKHGASKMIDQPWINIQAEMTDEKLQVKLINGKPSQRASHEHREQIGLANVKKRLTLLYAGRHELKILPEEDVYVVSLKVELVKGAI